MVGRRGFLVIGIVGGMLLSAFVASAHVDAAADLEAARQLQVQEQWAASESLATAALTRLEADPAPDSLAIAEALYRIGVARWRTVGYADGSGMRAAARSLGIRERRLPADHLDLADAHSLVARFLPEMGRADSAKVHVRRALAIRKTVLAPDDTLIAKTWDQLALIQRNSEDFRGALESWNQAIAIRQRAQGPESPEVARLIAQTGVPWMELGDLEKAREVLEESLLMFARTAGPDPPGRWIPLNILADVERRSWNLARNYDLLQEAYRIVRINYGEDSREALTMRANLAIALHDLDDMAGARALQSELLPRLQAQYGPAHPRTLNVQHGLAVCSSRMGDYATAMRLLLEAESLLVAREGPPVSNLSVVQGQISDLLYRQGQNQESRAIAERALRTSLSARQKAGWVTASAYCAHILPLAAIGDTAALAHARRELLVAREQYALGSSNMAATIQLNAAWASRHLNRDQEAWNHALDAERLSRERLEMSLRTLPDRRALLLARLEGRYLDLLLNLSRGSDAARQETVWDRGVRTRGLVRAEIARRRRPPGFESDSAIAGLHEHWMSTQRLWARRLVSTGGSPRDSATRVALETLRATVEESEGAYARALAERGTKVPAIEIGLAKVRSALRPGQALVGCFEERNSFGWQIGPDQRTSHVVAFVARGGSDAIERIERIELGTSADLSAVLDPWRERLAVSPGARGADRDDRNERECRRLGQKARTATWDKIAPHLGGATEVFLVADGPLVDVPWLALPEGASGYLVEAGLRLHVLNAERDLVQPLPATPSGAMLAIGAPDYDRGAVEAPIASTQLAVRVRSAPDPCASGEVPVFASLPGSGAEAAAVAKVWRADPRHEATVLIGAGASEQAFKREARGKAILHLATHGVVASDQCVEGAPGTRGVGGLDPLAASSKPRPSAKASAPAASPAASPVGTPRPRSPWMSRRVWLALAGANQAREHQSDENEGFLTAEEVLTLNLEGTDWVVLSACHSGLADAWSREGTLGMRRAFEMAGARTVIASQWAVEDAATLEWMEALYAARAGGATSASAALESASRTVLKARRNDGRSTHPFYWAAFSASGE